MMSSAGHVVGSEGGSEGSLAARHRRVAGELERREPAAWQCMGDENPP